MRILTFVALAAGLTVLPARAQEAGGGPSNEELAKAAQNPLSKMASLPFQLNTTFGCGLKSLEKRDTLCVLNIQPIIPISLNADWNLMVRTVVPVVSQPDPTTQISPVGGIGNVQEQLFFSPAKHGKVTWGVGPSIQFPTATNPILGSSRWAAGPAFLLVRTSGHWVMGVLAQDLWSFAGPHGAPRVNQLLFQYFINYNFKKGWYIGYAPINTADWTQSDNRDRWTVPLGLGFGKIFRIGKRPVNAQLGLYYNVIRPTGSLPSGPYTIRFQLQFLFPKR